MAARTLATNANEERTAISNEAEVDEAQALRTTPTAAFGNIQEETTAVANVAKA